MSRTSSKRSLITFTVILVLAMFPISWILYTKAKKIENEVNQYQENLQSLEEDQSTDEIDTAEERSLMESLLLKRIQVPVRANEKEAHIDVYWRSDSEAFLVIKNLPKLQPGEQYEVWSINEQQQTSLGLYSSPPGGTLIVKSKKALMRDSYDVRIVGRD